MEAAFRENGNLVRAEASMKTARSGIPDKMLGLRFGAYDYMVKPFSTIRSAGYRLDCED